LQRRADEYSETAKQKNERVFVHCIIGKSRSAAVVIAYLMQHHKMSLKAAYEHVKQQRSIIQPNDGFMKQLMALELQLTGVNTLQEGDWTPSHRTQVALLLIVCTH
jgi:protein-tyrosine phosphatase